MSILNIETGTDNEILRKKSVLITKIDKKIKKFAQNMLDTLNKEKGLGLAAPQVGENIRMILARLNHETSEEVVITMINPEIINTSEEMVCGEEGCLSVPGIYDQVDRYRKIRLKYQDLSGNTQVLELEDLNARIIQHEIDHIDGILFVDRVKEHSGKSDMKAIAF